MYSYRLLHVCFSFIIICLRQLFQRVKEKEGKYNQYYINTCPRQKNLILINISSRKGSCVKTNYLGEPHTINTLLVQYAVRLLDSPLTSAVKELYIISNNSTLWSYTFFIKDLIFFLMPKTIINLPKYFTGFMVRRAFFAC